MANTPVSAEDEVKNGSATSRRTSSGKSRKDCQLIVVYSSRIFMISSLSPWKSSGDGLAAFLNLEGTGGFNDSYVARDSAGQVTESPSPLVRRDHLHSQRAGRHFCLDRSE